MRKNVVIMGAGPAGLTAGAHLTENDCVVTILEKDPRYVGGIARTEYYKGFRFDIGGHRFFSKSEEVTRWWKKRLPNDFIQVKRLSRIFYRGKFFDYPLKAMNALMGLGIVTSARCMFSYLQARISPIQPEKSFADWVTNRFGQRLFNIFFKTYTEKVWGRPCHEISADWAAQRIKGLSLLKAVIHALIPQHGRGKKVVKTLIDEFDYPLLGPGMMWEKARDDIRAAGNTVAMNTKVTRILHDGRRVTAVIAQNGQHEKEFRGDAFISSLPLRECVLALTPSLAPEVLEAAKRLEYRDFLTVALMIQRTKLFPDNWIYVHDPSVKLGRIQNFNNWSMHLIPDPNMTCLGLEYFCFEGDELWNTPDEKLIELGKMELEKLSLVASKDVMDGAVVRMPKAYPVYVPGYQDDVEKIKTALSSFENFQVIGRNGMHKYNNQDHSMMTAILAARNVLEENAPHGRSFNLWDVNSDAEYHESGQRVSS
ncbi:MAG: NAD(P)/FAD-dependent oxidoreductase [Verrucomicrobiota bacterium]